MAVNQLLSLCQDVNAAFSPMKQKNELVSKEEGRPILADGSCLRTSHVEKRKRDALSFLASCFQVSSILLSPVDLLWA